ncbi:hypothetical protein WR25_14873 isoform B [Diploscapter pachys]|uniref:TBC1 domain family member 23 n=1 Tax=Diploscapter pachys TaxID=2018661 RepID=A0A2A2LV27_9BILA|nr:hypothetical protein WR25_14873 isoform B [Diploscapter pachys]
MDEAEELISSGSAASTVGDDWVKESSVDVSTGLYSLDDRMIWPRLLGVATKPNPLHEWDQLYNLHNQAGLRNDCRKLAKSLDNKKTVPELESFMTLYCKKRNVDYKNDSGWIEVLEKIIKLDLPSDYVFNVFYAFTTKYIPRETRQGSQIYDLFRLIVQYHDPQLNAHLESLKCHPFLYCHEWFSCLLASAVDDNVCASLWTLYIEKGDAFLIFYMALVLLVNARDQLLAISHPNRDKALVLLKELPQQIAIDDTADFVQLASHYADRTPHCIGRDFHYVLFGANYDEEIAMTVPLNKMLCLPVSVQEITKRRREAIEHTNAETDEPQPISYFVIDGRSREAFSQGHLQDAVGLDCTLFVDFPEEFKHALQTVESHREAFKSSNCHIAFMGYGDDEKDSYLHMVLSKFIRDNKPFVSIVVGGYKVLHRYVFESNRPKNLIASHNEQKCAICTESRAESSSWNIMSKMKDIVISKSSSVKDKVAGVLSSPSMNQLVEGSGNAINAIKHISPNDKTGKRYRQQDTSIFSLEVGDSSDEEEESAFGTAASTKKEELVLAGIKLNFLPTKKICVPRPFVYYTHFLQS